MEVSRKRSQENAPKLKQKRIRQKEQQDYRKKNKCGDIEKWDQTDSPKIPDRGEASETPASLRGRRERDAG